MSALKLLKVTGVPETLEPNAIYLVADPVNPEKLSMYVVNSDGTAARRTPTQDDLDAMIASAIADIGAGVSVVENIAARDALAPKNAHMVHVLDASADSTVTSGAALYIYNTDAGGYSKLTEFESLDVQLTWASLQGKPTSSAADIDAAVNQKHQHANKTTLDQFGVDDNGLHFSGSSIVMAGEMNW